MNNSSQLSVQDLVKLIQKNPDQSEAILNWYLAQQNEPPRQGGMLLAGNYIAPQGMEKAGLNKDGSYGGQSAPPPSQPPSDVPTGPKVDMTRANKEILNRNAPNYTGPTERGNRVWEETKKMFGWQ